MRRYGKIIAIGRTGVVVQRGSRAFKIPRKEDTIECDENDRIYLEKSAEIASESLMHESIVYQHLGSHDGILKVFAFAKTGLEMAFMGNGDLSDHLSRDPPISQRLAWIRQMASTIKYVHDKHVIIADIATRNFLVADDLSIRLCDFTESTIMSPNVDMDKAEDSGFSVLTDLGQFGAVMYEVLTGWRCRYDLFAGQDESVQHPKLPDAGNLPTTDELLLGLVIRKCWNGAYRNMNELCHDLI